MLSPPATPPPLAEGISAEVRPQPAPATAQGYGPVRDARAARVAPRKPRPRPPVATPAAATGPLVTIADFAFSAPTTTVRVGQTVTWTNRGPSSHTATAGDGSFNTGVLRRGASASHRFTTAGTFSYMCTIHPSMKGTIRVVAAAGSTPTAPSAPQASGAGSTAKPAPRAARATPEAGPQLPATGADPLAVAAAGLTALGAGLLCRRLAAIRWFVGS